MNDYESKLQAAMTELENSGIWRSNYAPPVFRVQRYLGQAVRPPHYAGFWRTMIGYGVWFGGVWGIFMWFAVWRAQGLPVSAAITAAVPAGAMFGVMIAMYYRWSHRRHQLSRWEDL